MIAYVSCQLQYLMPALLAFLLAKATDQTTSSRFKGAGQLKTNIGWVVQGG
jgi:hypothetical protein